MIEVRAPSTTTQPSDGSFPTIGHASTTWVAPPVTGSGGRFRLARAGVRQIDQRSRRRGAQARHRRANSAASSVRSRSHRSCCGSALKCFLATSIPANITFYERIGFRVTEQIELPADGPRETLMVREPRQV
jgi:hypothetical protein